MFKKSDFKKLRAMGFRVNVYVKYRQKDRFELRAERNKVHNGNKIKTYQENINGNRE